MDAEQKDHDDLDDVRRRLYTFARFDLGAVASVVDVVLLSLHGHGHGHDPWHIHAHAHANARAHVHVHVHVHVHAHMYSSQYTCTVHTCPMGGCVIFSCTYLLHEVF